MPNLRVRALRAINHGKSYVPCPYHAPPGVVTLDYLRGNGRARIAGGMGGITRDRREPDSAAFLTLELAPDALPMDA